MSKRLQVVTWARWRMADPFAPEFCTVFTASILKPTWEYPVACASMVIHKGLDKVFMRLTYESLLMLYVVPEVYRDRLAAGYREAQWQAQVIQEQQKTLHKLSNLQPGAQIVNTGTGEVLLDAEQVAVEYQKKEGL